MKSLLLTLSAICTLALLPVFLTLSGVVEGRFACDALTQIVPLIVEFKRMMASGAPWWTWNQLIGDNFLGSNGFYTVGNPFAAFCALFPLKYIGVGVILSIYAMFLLNGVAAMAYLLRLGFDENLSRLGALMYALSSYAILSFFYYTFPLLTILFPLLLIAIENLLDGRRRSVAMLALTVFACLFTNFYFGALDLMLGGIYVLFRIWSVPRGRRLSTLGRGIYAVLLGLLMSCLLLLPVILCNSGTARNVMVDLSYYDGPNHLWVFLRKLCCMFMPEYTENLVSTPFFFEFSSGHFYLPVVSLCMASAYIATHLKSWLSWLLISLTVVYLTPLNAVFSFGASIIYGRWAFAIVLFAIVATLCLIREGNVRHYWIYAAVMLVGPLAFYAIKVINYIPMWSFWAHIPGVISPVLWGLGCVLFAACFIGGFTTRKLTAAVVLMGGVIACVNTLTLRYEPMPGERDMILTNYFVNNPVPHSDSTYFTYRTDVLPSRAVQNHSCYSNIPSITSFHSVKNRALNDFLLTQGEPTLPTFIMRRHRESNAALLSVREVMELSNPADYTPPLYAFGLTPDTLRSAGRLLVYSNDNYIPIGFCYDRYFPREELEDALQECFTERQPDVARLMLGSIVLSRSDAAELQGIVKPVGEARFDLPLDSLVAERRKGHAEKFRGTTRGFTAIAPRSEQTRLMFFSVPADPGFRAYVDDRETKIYVANLGMSAIVVPPGRHEIRFDYFPPGLKTGAILSLFGWLLWLLRLCRPSSLLRRVRWPRLQP
ncbi:MAG: YfhO family protein [Bacteroidales bacterium]|nr:YfhO family protein [Bacteroidales bacterium]